MKATSDTEKFLLPIRLEKKKLIFLCNNSRSIYSCWENFHYLYFLRTMQYTL